jgi:hypothetical protein
MPSDFGNKAEHTALREVRLEHPVAKRTSEELPLFIAGAHKGIARGCPSYMVSEFPQSRALRNGVRGNFSL